MFLIFASVICIQIHASVQQCIPPSMNNVDESLMVDIRVLVQNILGQSMSEIDTLKKDLESFKAELKDCGEPPKSSDVTWSPGTTDTGSVRQYTCASHLFPTIPIPEVMCQFDGTWSKITGFCKNMATCSDVKSCNRTYGDGTYLLYPSPLGGHALHVYCYNMTTTPKAYITLHEENRFRSDFSLRTNSYPCQFRDRLGDAWSLFKKVGVNLRDMSVDRDDFTFAIIHQESQRGIPNFGTAAACAFDYSRDDHCPAPGTFVINTSGTGLRVDPNLQWKYTNYYHKRTPIFSRSADGLIIRAAVDGWCCHYEPVGTIYLLYYAPAGTRGTAITPKCG